MHQYDYQYLPLEEALTFTGLNKKPFLELMVRGFFTPCFLCNTKLQSFVDIGEEEPLAGYIPFRGFITFDKDKILEHLIGDTISQFNVSRVFIKESLCDNFIFCYEDYISDQGTQQEIVVREEIFGQELDLQKGYRIYPENSQLQLTSDQCVFPRSELEANLARRPSSVQNDTHKTSDKDIFKLVIPIVTRYIRHRDRITIDLGSKAGSKGSIKNLVLAHITAKQNGLDFLLSVGDFDYNWRETMKTKIPGLGMSLLEKIFEEELKEKQ